MASKIWSKMTDSVLTTHQRFPTAKLLLKRFYKLQEERVKTYKLFEEGFKAYVESAPLFNFPLYRQLVHEITQTFLNISQEIVTIKTSMVDNHQLKQIAANIDTIQDEEKKKLDLTASLQLSRQHSKDHPDDEKFIMEISDTRKSIQEVMETINEILEEIKFDSEDLYTESDND